MTKYIKVSLKYERLCEAIPEKYEGVTDINEMVEIEKKLHKDPEIIDDFISYHSPTVIVEVVDL